MINTVVAKIRQVLFRSNGDEQHPSACGAKFYRRDGSVVSCSRIRGHSLHHSNGAFGIWDNEGENVKPI